MFYEINVRISRRFSRLKRDKSQRIRHIELLLLPCLLMLSLQVVHSILFITSDSILKSLINCSNLREMRTVGW